MIFYFEICSHRRIGRLATAMDIYAFRAKHYLSVYDISDDCIQNGKYVTTLAIVFSTDLDKI